MNQYSERRNKILNSMEGNCAFVFFSGKAPMRSQDEAYDFYVDRNFYYLTGLDKEDMEHYKQNLCKMQVVAAEAVVEAGMVVAVKHMQVQVEVALDIWAHP